MLKCSIKIKNNSNIIKKIDNALPIAIEAVMKIGQEEALKNKHGNKDSDLITYDITSNKKEVIGCLHTNFEHAPFLEFGTGTKADGTLPHIGHTKTFKDSGMRYWYMPKELADAKGKEFSPQRLIIIDGKEYYIMYATKPYPFMRPTAFYLEDKAIKILADEIKKKLRS